MADDRHQRRSQREHPRPHRKSGPKPLDPTDPSCELCLALPSKQFAALTARARAEQITVPEVIRRHIYRYLLPDRTTR